MTVAITIHPWLDWLTELSANLRGETAYALRPLLMRLFELRPTEQPERSSLGLIARRLLAFALEESPSNAWIVANAAQVVCATFDTARDESESLIRRLFTQERLATRGAEELPRIGEYVITIAAIAPDVVHDFYIAAFSYEEASRAATQLGGSVVLPLLSNRQQDYAGGLYVLARDYPKFLAAAPGQATAALISVVEIFRTRERRQYGLVAAREQEFTFHGITARVQSDSSTIWDELAHSRHEEALTMLDAFSTRLAMLADGLSAAELQPPTVSTSRGRRRRPTPPVQNAEHSRAQIEEIVAAIALDNRLAAIWRRLLVVGASHPAKLSRLLAPLAWAAPLLVGADTTVAAGNFLKAVYPWLTTEEREQAEYSVVHLAAGDYGSTRDIEIDRARLLGCLPIKLIVSRAARRRLADFRARDAVPVNEARARIETHWGPDSGRSVDDELLIQQGVDVDALPNRSLLSLIREAEAFATTHLNLPPTRDQALTVLPCLEAIRAAIRAIGPASGALLANAELAIARACAKIARGAPATCEGELGTFVRNELLAASRSALPHGDQGEPMRMGAWTLTPRTEAADGLPELWRADTCSSPAVRDAVKLLSRDPAPVVRMQVFWKLARLWNVDDGFVWNSLEQLAAHEQNEAVLQAALHGGLYPLLNVDPARVARLTIAVADRTPNDDSGKDLRNDCAGLLTGLDVWHQEAAAGERVQAIAGDPCSYPREAKHILHQLRDMMLKGDPRKPSPRNDSARHRSLNIMKRIVSRAAEQWAELHDVVRTQPEPDPKIVDQLRELASVLDGAGNQVHFAAQAADKTSVGTNGDEHSTAAQSQLTRLYDETGPIVDALAFVGLAHVAHHLLAFLEIMVPQDPQGVFLRIAAVVRAARATNYQYDSLAQSIVVRLVQRYLAEYRDLIEASAQCRASLLDVLDIFVQVGWPDALQLCYRLDEVYR